MATIITNQASVTYNYAGNTGSAESNIATATLEGVLSLSKTSLSDSYVEGRRLTYMITVTNSGETTVNGITVTDDLGTYTVTGLLTATPLTYVGPAQLFINGVFDSVLTPVEGEGTLEFTIPELAGGATAQIMYIVEVNEYAPLVTGSTVTNTATLSGGTACDGETASLTLTVEDFADVVIQKAITPETAICGETLTYTFDIYNYGNTAATEVVLTDVFDPAISDITVAVNGVNVDPTNFTYTAGTLTLPTGGGLTLTVPAATFTADEVTGEITVTPGHTEIVVTGTI